MRVQDGRPGSVRAPSTPPEDVMEATKHQFGPLDLHSMAALGAVRERFRSWLTQRSLTSGDRLEDILVVVSELGANAITATPRGRPPPTIYSRHAHDLLTIEVTNHVDGDRQLVYDGDLDDPLRPGGRGLLLVSAFADDLRVESRGDQLMVCCSIRLAGPG